jgi:hypothetical protein
MLDIPVVGQLRRMIALALVLAMAIGGAITAAVLLDGGDRTLGLVVGGIAGLLLLGGAIGVVVAMISAGRARSRRPGAPIAAADVRPGEPVVVELIGRGGPHRIWMSFDLARDRRPDRETRYDLPLDVTVEVAGRGASTTPLTVTWWSGMIHPYVGNLRGIAQPDGRGGPGYHLDLDSTGGRFRAHVMLFEVADLPGGTAARIQTQLALPPSFTSGRARLFVTRT